MLTLKAELILPSLSGSGADERRNGRRSVRDLPDLGGCGRGSVLLCRSLLPFQILHQPENNRLDIWLLYFVKCWNYLKAEPLKKFNLLLLIGKWIALLYSFFSVY